MKTILASCILAFLVSPVFAQPQSFAPMWQQLYLENGNDYCHTVRMEGDSILLVGDRGGGGLGLKDPMLMWLTSQGNLIDTSVAHTPDSVDCSYDGFPSGHNSIILCGTSYQDSYMNTQGFAEEVTLDGQCLWETMFSFPDSCLYDQGISAGCRTINGEYVFVGYAWMEHHPYGQAIAFWWVRCDSGGTIVAQDTVQVFAQDAFWGTAVTATRDGGVVVGGTNNGGSEMLLVKLDAAGRQSWHRFMQRPLPYGSGNIKRLLELPSGDLIVVGDYSALNFGEDIFVARLDNQGNQLWASVPNMEGDQWGRSVIPIEGNKLLVMGEAANVDSRRNVVLFTVDMQGRIHAFSHPVSSHPNNDYEVELRSVVQLPDSSFVVAGDGIFFQGTGIYHDEFYAARYGADLSVPQPPTTFDLFSPADHDTIRSQASPFVWTASSDPDPFDTVRYTLRIWNDADTLIRSALLDTSAVVAASDLLALGGTSNFHWTVSAHSSLPDTLVLARHIQEFRLESTFTNQRQTALPTGFGLSVYPNPFNSTARVSFTLPKTATTAVEVYDITGRMLERYDLGRMLAGTQEIEWNASLQASGMYVFILRTDNSVRSTKVLHLK